MKINLQYNTNHKWILGVLFIGGLLFNLFFWHYDKISYNKIYSIACLIASLLGLGCLVYYIYLEKPVKTKPIKYTKTK